MYENNIIQEHKQQTKLLLNDILHLIKKPKKRTDKTSKAIKEVISNPSKIYVVPTTNIKQIIVSKYDISPDRVYVIPPTSKGIYKFKGINKDRLVFDHYWIEQFISIQLQNIMTELYKIGAM